MHAFVGRESAVAALAGGLERPPALVLVEGEAGVGKTRLVQEYLWSGRWPERTVLLVECQPVRSRMPLAPVVDGLRRLRDRVGGVKLSPLGGALRPLFPEWVDDLPPPPEPLPEPGARRHRAYRALAELVDRLAVDLLVMEDAHWADSASLEWLQLAHESWDDRRSVVVTFRPQTVPPASPQLRRLAARMPRRVEKLRIVLQPLDVTQTRQMAAAMFRTDVSQEFAQFLHERTGGLPLAVEEQLKLLRDRGDIIRTDDGWDRKGLAEMQVPPNLRDSVLERVERLDSATRRVLEAAAVLGEPADDRLLARVAGLDMTRARPAVAAGFRAGLLRGAERGRVAFRHQLAAEAVEAEIPASERRRLHQRAGEALRAAGEPSVARLSRHFREAGDTDAWADCAEAIAELAQESGDDQTTVAVLHELLTSAEHPGPRRARLARKLGEAAASGSASLNGRAGGVIKAVTDAVNGGDIPASERGALRLILGRLLRWYGHFEAADREIEAAVPDLADQPDLACRAMLNLGLALSRDWPARQHLDWIERATPLVAQIDSPADRLRAAAVRVSALLVLGQEEGWRAATELPPVGSNLAEQRTILLSMADVGRFAIKWGRYAEASNRLGTAVELIQAAGYQRVLSIARAGRAYLDWYTGRWAGLAQSVAQLAEVDATDQLSVRIEAREIQALVELAVGSRRSAEQQLSAVLDGWSRLGPLGYEAATSAAALGRIRLAEGSAEQALQLTGPVMARIAKKELWLWATDALPVHFDALAGTGSYAQAEDLAGELAGWLACRNAPAPAAAATLCQAIMTEVHGDLDTAAGLFAKAAQAWAGLPRPYDELRALERQGRCLLATGEVDLGLVILSKAQQRLQELGARWDAARVARVLRQHGVEVPHSWRGGHRGYGDRLSPRERDVVALVAQGMTNREVGQAMFLSPKTVGLHLQRAMRKLGVSTRTAAAMAAAEAGLISATSPAAPASSSANE